MMKHLVDENGKPVVRRGPLLRAKIFACFWAGSLGRFAELYEAQTRANNVSEVFERSRGKVIPTFSSIICGSRDPDRGVGVGSLKTKDSLTAESTQKNLVTYSFCLWNRSFFLGRAAETSRRIS